MNSIHLANILLRNCTNKFFIEYEGFLSNHLSHGIIALSRLGANSERVERFVNWYTPRLEEPGKFRDEENIEDPTSLLGERKSYYSLVNTYKEELRKRDGSLEKLLADKFSGLFPGLIGSALHGLIQLGYGYAAKSAQVVCEGLAYMHHSYLPIKLSTAAVVRFTEEDVGKGPDDILKAVEKVRNNTEIHDFMKTKVESEEFQKLNTSDFQRKVKCLFNFRGDDILEYALSVHIPGIHKMEQLDTEMQCTALVRWLLETAIAIYALADRHDFFLLHGVTAAWSLLQIAPVAVGHSRQHVQELVKTFLCGLITVYISQDCLPLSSEQLKDGAEKENFWKTVIEDALDDDKDEHVYKLIQVCYELANETDNQDLKRLCQVAANRALNETFVF